MEGKKLRSPSYPVFDLGTAVDKVRAIQTAYNQSAVDREALARSMGYSSMSGSALTALSSLAGYGLLEKRGRGEAAVTDLAMQILFAESTEEHAQAARSAALSPPVFSQIAEKFGGHVPHTDGLESFLRRNRFTEHAAKIAAKTYASSMAFVLSLGDGDRSGEGVATGQNRPPDTNQEAMTMVTPANAVGEFRDLVRGNTSDGSTFRLLVNADFGAEQWEDAMEMLQVQFNIAKRKAERKRVEAQAQASEEGLS